ncbi:hypothetical protein [Clostridium perfringens]|uniref:hypothetical protein n=1 Tax=Clostridium perfringens TaxID=1502 RepID=UPI0022460468|nr:hypothetical protein [Clostridium perfringens]MCX0404216.1 hypothetical protein [Clostridium perfringens]
MFKKNIKEKRSIDFELENFKLLENAKETFKANSNNELINYLIRIFLNLKPSVKRNLATICKNEYEKLDKETYCSAAFERNEKEITKKQYKNLMEFFLDGEKENFIIEENNSMKKIEIQNGYVIFPEDWVILNEDDAKNCEYVGVIEVKNGTKYNSPHFLFFSTKPINELTNNDTKKLDEKCIKMFSDYQKILNDYIPLKYDEKGEMLNGKEHISGPIPGYFAILDYGLDISYYPLGAMVFRTDS